MQNWYDFWNIRPNCCSNPIMVAFLIYLTYSWIKIDKFRKHIFTTEIIVPDLLPWQINWIVRVCQCIFLFHSTFVQWNWINISIAYKYIGSLCGNILHYIAFDLCVNDFTIGKKNQFEYFIDKMNKCQKNRNNLHNIWIYPIFKIVKNSRKVDIRFWELCFENCNAYYKNCKIFDL